MDLARFAIEKRLISAVSTLLILFAGYFAYMNLPRFEDPEFIIRQAQLVTPYPGAGAAEVAEEVTEVIENVKAFSENPEDASRIIAPASRVGEISAAERAAFWRFCLTLSILFFSCCAFASCLFFCLKSQVFLLQDQQHN